MFWMALGVCPCACVRESLFKVTDEDLELQLKFDHTALSVPFNAFCRYKNTQPLKPSQKQ